MTESFPLWFIAVAVVVFVIALCIKRLIDLFAPKEPPRVAFKARIPRRRRLLR